MYSIADFGGMIADRVRMDAYTRALREAVRPCCAVADLGTGTGILALLACRFGARRVDAIDPNDAIDLGQQLAAANGFADRIVFHRHVVQKVSLPQPADVVVSDMRGVLPWHGSHLPALIDARRRFLAPGGVVIPKRDRLWISCAEEGRSWTRMESPWSSDIEGLDLSAALPMVTNTWWKVTLGAEQLLAPPTFAAQLDYEAFTDVNLDARVALTASRSGVGHGVCAWFDTDLVDGVGFSNAPGHEPPAIYGQAFFPWPERVSIGPGDAIEVRLRATRVGEDYIWSWDTVVRRGENGAVLARFHQTTFRSMTLSQDFLDSIAEDHVAAIGTDGLIDLRILTRLAEGWSLGRIVSELVDGQPGRSGDRRDALTRVATLCARYRS